VRVKLDENLGALAVTMFSDADHDVATIPGQNLGGRPDQAIYDGCRAEERLLVTLDLDFANPFRFDPRPTAGIAVIRVPTLPDSRTCASASAC
jgi:predicted nuclease of predicted toxin-antitoxin system